MEYTYEIVAAKDATHAVLIKIACPVGVTEEARDAFTKQALTVGLQEDGGGKLMDLGETMTVRKTGTEPYVAGGSTSTISEYCVAQDVILSADKTRGALVSVRPLAGATQQSKDTIEIIVHTIAEVALDTSIAYITDEEVFEDPSLETIKGKTRKVLLDALFPGSTATIKETLTQHGLEIGTASIFRIDDYEIVH